MMNVGMTVREIKDALDFAHPNWDVDFDATGVKFEDVRDFLYRLDQVSEFEDDHFTLATEHDCYVVRDIYCSDYDYTVFFSLESVA